MRIFLYRSSVYSCHLFLIPSSSVRSIPFLSFIVSIFTWNVPLISNFLEEISSLSHSIFSSLCLHWSLRKTLSVLAILWNCAFKWVYLPFSPLPLAFLFLGGWSWLLFSVQCHEPLSIVLQAHCLSDLIPWIYLPLPLYNQSERIWFRSYLNGIVVFPNFFNLSLILAVRSSWSEAQSAPGLVFADCIELLHLWLQRI